MANGVATKSAGKTVKTDGLFSRASRFLRESYIEVFKKASWPSWPELKKFTLVVLFAIIIVGVWIGALDWVLTQVTRELQKR
jgi:preprotein translocase SecE subunit